MREKPTFPQLLAAHHIKIPQLAGISQIDILDVSAMYLEHPVKRNIAERVLEGLNTLCGTQYTLQNTALRLREGGKR
jgi:hypothetical protein